MSNEDNKTVFMSPAPDAVKKSGNKTPLILMIAIFALVVCAALYYFLIYNSEPKIRIEYAVNGSIEQKNSNNFEQLYKSPSSLQLSVILSKAPKKDYLLDVNGTKNKLEFSAEGEFYKASLTLNPNQKQNSYYSISLTGGESKTLFTDNFNVIIIKPNISSKEFIENYLKTYSSAVSNKSSSDLLNASNYWHKDYSSGIYDKMRKGFSELTYLYSDNVISTPEDDVNAKVYFSYNKNNKWTNITTGYNYELTVIKNNSGLPEWKILQAKETVEKKESFDMRGDMEGD